MLCDAVKRKGGVQVEVGRMGAEQYGFTLLTAKEVGGICDMCVLMCRCGVLLARCTGSEPLGCQAGNDYRQIIAATRVVCLMVVMFACYAAAWPH
jgi:hypothetical protein